jgi:hypothetical protein
MDFERDFTRRHIEELEKQVARLERHNAIYHPEYDPERDAPMDAAWEAGNRAAWRNVVATAEEHLWGENTNKALLQLESQLADTQLALREMWESLIEEPFPHDLHLADVVKRIGREIAQ